MDDILETAQRFATDLQEHFDSPLDYRVWEKVRGRLLNGAEDNIPFYIAGYKEHIEIGNTKPGYFATIV